EKSCCCKCITLVLLAFAAFFIANLIGGLIHWQAYQGRFTIPKHLHYSTKFPLFKGFNSEFPLFKGFKSNNDRMEHLIDFSESDRIVWKRAPECIVKSTDDGGTAIDLGPLCPQYGEIVLEAYSYDTTLYTESSYGRRFGEFKHRVMYGEQWRGLIEFHEDHTDLTISDPTGLVWSETVTMPHTPCDDYEKGYYLGPYFGGNPRAPEQIWVNFEDVPSTL
ncbi:hypothetical protein KIPB_009295, partial [Kipferlia bialata]